MVSNFPRLQIRFAHYHLGRHASHSFHIYRDAKLRLEVSCADPPVPGGIEERDGAGCANGDGPEAVGVEEEEAVGKVAAAGESKEGELVLLGGGGRTRGKVVGGGDFVYDGEEEEVIAEGAFGDVFVAVAVVVA